MKYGKILRMFVVTLILSLLLTAIPVLPVYATNDTTLSPASGKVGDTITITGTAFTPSTATSEKWARIIFARDSALVGQYIDTNVSTYEDVKNAFIGEEYTSTEGEFSTTFTVPANLTDGSVDAAVASGTYYVYVTFLGATLIKSKAQFTIASGAITVTPVAGPVDTALRIVGTGFVPSTTITVTYDGTAVAIGSGDVVTKTNGALDSTIYVPEGISGGHTISVTVGSSEVSTTFTVTPDIIITPQSGAAGATVLISCTGFARRAVPTIYFNAYPVETLTPVIATTSGSFSASFYVPEGLTAGVYTVEADDGTNLATASFTVNVAPPAEPTPEPEPEPEPEPDTSTPPPTTSVPPLSINSSGDTVGSNIGIGGAGFTPNALVTIKYDDTEIATAIADAGGQVISIFTAPPSTAGEHIITVSDGTHTNTITYTVESVAPSIPSPLLPEMGVKVKSPATFDWEDVTDDSMPVTYNLQIAVDDNFTESSIVLYKTGIELSTYMLTEAEELQLSGRKEALYWRVQALDGASNASEWTGSGEFYVSGGTGSFTGWPLYTICGIGAVLLFGIGYWLGRRTAFYY